MNAKIIQVSLTVLEKLLHLPEGAKITGVNKELAIPHQVEFLIEDPSLPEVPEYSRIPLGTLLYHAEYCESCKYTRIIKSEIVD